jgi:hypothetical protein
MWHFDWAGGRGSVKAASGSEGAASAAVLGRSVLPNATRNGVGGMRSWRLACVFSHRALN